MGEPLRHTGKLLIFTHHGDETGFRLGGAPTRAIGTEEELNRSLATLLDRGESALIALPESMLPWVSPKNLRRIDKSLFPLLLSYPGREPRAAGDSLEERIGMMVKRTLGYRIKIEL